MINARSVPGAHLRLVAYLTAGFGCIGWAAPATGEERLAFEGFQTVSAERLASMRGGFAGTVNGARLEVSFGIERIVSIDGEIVAATSFRIPALSSLEGLKALPSNLLQSGARNLVSPDVQAAAGGTLAVIQNTLDNQVLRQVTTIDASVRNLELHRAGQLGEALNRQLFMSLR